MTQTLFSVRNYYTQGICIGNFQILYIFFHVVTSVMWGKMRSAFPIKPEAT